MNILIDDCARDQLGNERFLQLSDITDPRVHILLSEGIQVINIRLILDPALFQCQRIRIDDLRLILGFLQCNRFHRVIRDQISESHRILHDFLLTEALMLFFHLFVRLGKGFGEAVCPYEIRIVLPAYILRFLHAVQLHDRAVVKICRQEFSFFDISLDPGTQFCKNIVVVPERSNLVINALKFLHLIHSRGLLLCFVHQLISQPVHLYSQALCCALP